MRRVLRWLWVQLKATLAWALRHPHYKLLALATGVGVWLFVQGRQVVTDRVRVEVQWVTPVDLLSTESLPSTVAVHVEGSLSAVRKAKRAELTLLADLSEATVGETSVEFATFSLRGLPSNVTAASFSPSSIRFTLDEATTRKVEVEPLQVGTPSPGYEVVDMVLEPSVVELRGPRVTLDEVVKVLTKPIDISNLAGDSDLQVELDLPRATQLTEEVEVVARVDVESVWERRSFENISVAVDHYGWIPEPSEVTVVLKGPASALRELGADDVNVIARLPDETSESRLIVAHGPTEGVRLDVSYSGERLEESVTPQQIEVRKK